MKNIPLLSFLIFHFFAQAQFDISGIVIDATTQLPIPQAEILNTVSKNSHWTDYAGAFTIQNVRKIQLSATGYVSKKITIPHNQHIKISLFPIMNELEEVIINKLSIPTSLKKAMDAVHIVKTSDINRGNAVELSPILNQIPGVFMQSGSLNTNRITIRGIGARNLFGTANIRAYFGDIPLTDGNGESAIEDLELAAVSSMEIHKGPAASSYGVGLGGTIIMKPAINMEGTNSSFKTMLGSYGLQKNLLEIAHKNQKLSTNLIMSTLQSDGYRYNNRYDRKTATLISELDINSNNTLSFLGSLVKLNAEIPSSLTLTDFNNNPREAAFTWGKSKAFEDVDYGILGLTWNHLFSKNTSQYTSIFTSFRNNYEPRPFNILQEKSNTFGVRSKVLGHTILLKKEIDWTTGGELFYEFYKAQTFQNLYEEIPSGMGSVKGNQLSDLDEQRNYYNLFVEATVRINEKLRIHTGLHLNQTFFDIKDQFVANTDNSSGNFKFQPIASPKIGANYIASQHLIIFANISHGFSTPTTSETVLPEGTFNPAIKPEIGWNYEVGTNYTFFNNRLYGSASIYSLRVDDLLVARRTTEDNFYAINAGKTVHNGLEAALNVRLIQLEHSQYNLFVNTSMYNYTFNEFVDLDTDFSGNKLTGVPSSVSNFGIDLRADKGFYGTLSFQWVGEIPVNDANTVFSDSYTLLHGKTGYSKPIGSHLNFDIYMGINNMMDSKYASQLQVNAVGFGSKAPRYFYPGLPFTIFGGININYRL